MDSKWGVSEAPSTGKKKPVGPVVWRRFLFPAAARAARRPTTALALMNDLHWMGIDDYNQNYHYYSLLCIYFPFLKPYVPVTFYEHLYLCIYKVITYICIYNFNRQFLYRLLEYYKHFLRIGRYELRIIIEVIKNISFRNLLRLRFVL